MPDSAPKSAELEEACHGWLFGEELQAWDSEETWPGWLSFIPLTARVVLDIGCYAGRLGSALKRRQAATVIGWYWEPQAAEAARARLDQVIYSELEGSDPGFALHGFDAVVCNGIFERLRDPVSLLRRIHRWVRPDGVLVACVYNARHHTIVRGLLDGDWTYDAGGVLDHGHLQFFTRQDLRRRWWDAGWVITRWEPLASATDQAAWKQQQPGEVRSGGLMLGGLPTDIAEEYFTSQYLFASVPVADARPNELGFGNSVPGLDFPGKLGCVLAVRDRPVALLERTLQTYVYQTRQADDKVLIDYGSAPNLGSAYDSLCQRYGWRFVRPTPAPASWCLSAAYNAAVAALDPAVDWIFKNDADVLLGQDVLEVAALLGRSRFCLFSCLKTPEDTRYPDVLRNQADLLSLLAGPSRLEGMDGDGLFACPRHWFERIGGFDRAFAGWGYEDCDLCCRAERSLGAVTVTTCLLIHQWHPRSPVPDSRAHRNRTYHERMRHSGLAVRNRGQVLPGPRPTASVPAGPGGAESSSPRVVIAQRSADAEHSAQPGDRLANESAGHAGPKGQRAGHTENDSTASFRELLRLDTDWVVTLDEHAFVVRPDLLTDLVGFLEEHGFAACGMPDGGVVSVRRQNPVACNACFTVLDLRRIRPVWRRWSQATTERHRTAYERLVPPFARQKPFAFDESEPYYSVFFALLSAGERIWYLDAEQASDGISTAIKHMTGAPLAIHCWHANNHAPDPATQNRYQTVLASFRRTHQHGLPARPATPENSSERAN
jgi:SAM-dependent methyltransferase